MLERSQNILSLKFGFGCAGSLTLCSSFLEWRLVFVVGHRFLIAVASLIVGHRLCGSRASIVAVCRLSNCTSWTLEHRFSSYGTGAYPTARGIVLDQGSKPCLLHWQVDSLPLSHHRSPPEYSVLGLRQGL